MDGASKVSDWSAGPKLFWGVQPVVFETSIVTLLLLLSAVSAVASIPWPAGVFRGKVNDAVPQTPAVAVVSNTESPLGGFE